MTCDETKERLIDFLYRELPAQDHVAFEAHVAGCDACRREVESLGGTLTTARTAVRSTLDDPPPSRVRVAVLEAARAAAGSALLAARVPVKPAAVPDKGSFWDFLRPLRDFLRRPWVIPSFAVASLMVLLVSVRSVILQPEEPMQVATVDNEVASKDNKAAPEAKQQGLDLGSRLEKERGGVKVALPRAERMVSPTPPASAPAPSDSYERLPPREMQTRPAANARRASAPHKAAAKPVATAPPPAPMRPRRDLADDALGGLGSVGRSSGGAASGWERAKVAEEPPAPAAKGEARRVAEEKADKTSTRELDQPLKKAAPGRYATPPPPVAPAAPAVATARPPAPEPAMAESAPAPQGAADEEASRQTKAKRAKREESPFEQLSQRAERAFSAQRWAEAAAAFRELIRLYPDNTLLASWKGRLRASEVGLASSEKAKAGPPVRASERAAPASESSNKR